MRVGDSVANRREREREKENDDFPKCLANGHADFGQAEHGGKTEATKEGMQTKPLLDDSFAFRHKFFCHKVLTVCVCVRESTGSYYYYYPRRFFPHRQSV